jgi:hypothetical protein
MLSLFLICASAQGRDFNFLWDDIPEDVEISFLPYFPPTADQEYYFEFKERLPYQVLDYRWRCCFLDSAEHEFIMKRTRYRIQWKNIKKELNSR